MGQHADWVRTLSPEQLALLVRRIGHQHQSTPHPSPASSNLHTPAVEPPPYEPPPTDDAIQQERALHSQFEVQATRQPDAIAIVDDHLQLTYGALNRRANQLAHYLQSLGVGPEAAVGICMPLSIDMVMARLAVLKTGGAYVPMEPNSSSHYLTSVLETARVAVILTQEGLCHRWSTDQVQVVCLDTDWPQIASYPSNNLVGKITPDHTAYVIYTAVPQRGPRGLMVSHRNVVHLCTELGQGVGELTRPLRLAHTDVSADDAMVDVFWALTDGGQVILLSTPGERVRSRRALLPTPDQGMQFSLFFFASDESHAAGDDKYRLFFEAAKFADQHGFTAIWCPERLFHRFGGLYPSPSVLSAALAMATERIQLRAGSVVLPLHHPIRVAEEWAVVDHLSNGRVGIAVASGWHTNDFVLAPESHLERRSLMYEQLQTVQRLWRGEMVTMRGGAGEDTHLELFPKPLQPRLPIWLTSNPTSNTVPTTFMKAGEIGAHVLTALLLQSLDDVERRIALYRSTLAQHGHDPQAGHVTLMLHTFLGADVDAVRETVRGPMRRYIQTFTNLLETQAQTIGLDIESFSDDDREALLDHVFERYFDTRALFGSPGHCLDMIKRLQAIGVNEVACLIDFGVDVETVLDSLHYLHMLKERSGQQRQRQVDMCRQDILCHRVSLLQCSPMGWQQLATDSLAQELVPSLQAVIVSRDHHPTLPAPRQRPASLTLYGTSESTGGITVARIEPRDRVPPDRDIRMTRPPLLMNEHFQPVAAGAPGQLCLRGASIPLGFHHDPALTAATWVPNPLNHLPGDRLYHTGKTVRYQADGELWKIQYLQST